jgi:signal transduction histidine kinase
MISIPDIIELSKTYEKNEDFADTEQRFSINLRRLTSLFSFLKEKKIDVRAIYLSDYIQYLDDSLKVNLNTPILCRNEYIVHILNILAIQDYRNSKTNNSSFSHFLFNRVNKVFTFIFKIGSTFSIALKAKNNLKYVEVTFPVDGYSFKYKGSRSLDYVKLLEENQDWSYFTIEDIVNNEADIKYHDYADKYINDYINKNPNILQEFKDFICTSLNTKIDDDFFLKNIIWTMWTSLLVGNCQSFTYIPSIIRKDSNEKDVSSGGLIVPQFQNQQTISLDLIEELYVLVQMWFSKNAVADFSKLTETTIKQEDNVKQLHTLSSGISNVEVSFSKMKEITPLDTKQKRSLFSKAEEGIQRLSFLAKAVLSLDKKKRGKIKPRFIHYTKDTIFKDIETIISQASRSAEFRRNFLSWVRDIKNSQWIDFEEQSFFEVEESFLILIHELLKNAVEFTDRENIKMNVFLSKQDDYLLLRIINTIPMDEKIQNYINNNFSNYSSVPVVRGYGLSLIESVLSFLNGTIKVSIDKETKFTHSTIKIYKYEQNHYLSSR